jgi:hypothetical protein
LLLGRRIIYLLHGLALRLGSLFGSSDQLLDWTRLAESVRGDEVDNTIVFEVFVFVRRASAAWSHSILGLLGRGSDAWIWGRDFLLDGWLAQTNPCDRVDEIILAGDVRNTSIVRIFLVLRS